MANERTVLRACTREIASSSGEGVGAPICQYASYTYPQTCRRFVGRNDVRRSQG